MRILVFLAVWASCVWAETRTLTLREAVDIALKQNPDLVLQRFEEQKAEQNVESAKDPFYPKFVLGSGLAYSHGYPLGIENAAPSVIRAQGISTLFNRTKTYQLAEAKQNARTNLIDMQAKRDDVAYRTAAAYLDAERATLTARMASTAVGSYEKVLAGVRARVQEGRELPIEERRAQLNLRKSQDRAKRAQMDLEYLESSLAVILGYGANDRVQVSDEQRTPLTIPASVETTVDTALKNSREIRRLQSAVIAEGFEIKAQRATRLPTVDLVAQYALFSKYNNYDLFFKSFQRNNWELGGSINVPLLPGTAAKAQLTIAQLEASRLREQMKSTREQISLTARRAYDEMQMAQDTLDLAKQDLDLAREDLSNQLALMGEGRVTMQAVETARSAESERWIALYDAQNTLEKARLNVLRQAGSLVAALQ